jgi:DNA polymerase III subunit chi
VTKIDFYITPGQTTEQRHVFACRLVEKAYKLNHNVYIHSNDSGQAQQLEELLWAFRSSSFIPHRLQSGDEGGNERVVVGHGECLVADPYLMINLSEGVPECFSRFERVSEIVVQDSTITESTRQNYRFYRDRGYPLDSHDLRK